MAVLRAADGVVHRSSLDAVWADARQRERCLRTLVGDGLVRQVTSDRYTL
jgi:A/G-specific adenine glycosylase